MPANFQPTSVTFIGGFTGAVIGQAGTPGHCATPVLHLAGGHQRLRPDLVRGERAAHRATGTAARGVGQLRFLKHRQRLGVRAPALGHPRRGPPTGSRRRPTGCGSPIWRPRGPARLPCSRGAKEAARTSERRCTSVSLYTSSMDGDQWQQVAGPTAEPAARRGLPGRRGQSGARRPQPAPGYLLAPSGELLSGPLTGAAWTIAAAQAPLCSPGPPGPGRQPTGALLAAPSASHSWCARARSHPGRDSQTKVVMQSSNGGTSWSTAAEPRPPSIWIATSLAAAQGNALVVLATDACLYLSTDGGVSWQLARPGPAEAAACAAGIQLRRHDQRRPRASRCPPTPACTRCSSPPTAAPPGNRRRSALPDPPPPPIARAHPQPAQHAEHLLELTPRRSRPGRSPRPSGRPWPGRTTSGPPRPSRPASPGRRPGWACASTRPWASSRLTMLVTLVGWTISRSPISRNGSAPSRLNRSRTSASYRANVSRCGRSSASSSASRICWARMIGVTAAIARESPSRSHISAARAIGSNGRSSGLGAGTRYPRFSDTAAPRPRGLPDAADGLLPAGGNGASGKFRGNVCAVESRRVSHDAGARSRGWRPAWGGAGPWGRRASGWKAPV